MFLGLAVLSAAAVPLVLALGRHPAPTHAAAVALAVQCVLFLALRQLHARPSDSDRRPLTAAVLVLVGLLTAPLGWFFGPHAPLAPLLAAGLIVVGVATGGPDAPLSKRGGWLAYGAIALAQLGAFVLIVTRVLPDHSLHVVIISEKPVYIPSHVALQGLYLTAFLVGKRFGRRYAALADDVARTVRAGARHEALLEEARADYLRALDQAKQGLFTNRVVGEYRIGTLVQRGGITEVYDAVGPDGTHMAVRIAPGPRQGFSVEELPTLLRGDARGRLRAGERLDRAALLRLARDVGDELEAMHARGMAHGAVSLASIARSEDGGFELVDVSTGADPGSPALLRYLAPERVMGQAANALGDVYGLAAVLHAAATGAEPYAGTPDEKLAAAVIAGEPESAPAPDLSEAALAVIRTSLANSPIERHASARELCDSFAIAVAAEGSSSAPSATPLGTGRSTMASTASKMSAASAAETPVAAAPSDVWSDAFRSKMRGFALGMTVLCLAGGALLFVVVRRPGPLLFAEVCIAAILGLVWLHGSLRSSATRGLSYWPWVLIGVLSVGPAHSYGLHSAFGAVISLWLFAGGMFKAGAQVPRRGRVLVAVVASHTLVFVLIWIGVVPDHGNTAILQSGAPWWEAGVLHALLVATWIGSFAAGGLVDARHRDLTVRAEEAARTAAKQEVLLAAAREELDLAQTRAGGIFAGAVLGGYEVNRLIGRGGMGEVYEARAARSGERVALKVVNGERVANPESVRMLLAEAAVMTRIESDHVSRVLEVSPSDAELPYIAMELVEGRSLSAILRERETLPLDEVVRLVREVCAGLADVHARGLLHCDIKPSNVIRTDGGPWKIVDFGVSRRPGPSNGLIVGTPGYMAPEQALGRDIDARIDLYALGLVAYRAITGRPAYTGGDRRAVARAATSHAPPSPHAYADVPAEVGLVLRVAIASAADDRFASASDFARAFENAAAGLVDPELRGRAEALLERAPWLLESLTHPTEAVGRLTVETARG